MLNEFRQKHNNNSSLQAIAHCNTVLSQIVIIFSRHGFQTLANKFHTGLNLLNPIINSGFSPFKSTINNI